MAIVGSIMGCAAWLFARGVFIWHYVNYGSNTQNLTQSQSFYLSQSMWFGPVIGFVLTIVLASRLSQGIVLLLVLDLLFVFLAICFLFKLIWI